MKLTYYIGYGGNNMGYLQCQKCGGYYELQEGEKANDYDYCQCGGELKYHLSYDDLRKSDSPTNVEGETKKSSNKGLIIVLLIGGLFLFLIFIIIPALLIYRSYFASDPSDIQNATTINSVRGPIHFLATLFSLYLG